MSSLTMKRIRADMRDLQKSTSSMYTAVPMENDPFEWHFTIRGPPETEFEGGIYHGRILLPSEYPIKPPNIMFMTENGRFEVGTKICLSISAYHPETWSPAWGIRLMLEALVSLLPTPGEGAVGALDYNAAERKRLAKASKTFSCPVCGRISEILRENTGQEKVDPEVQKLVSKLHLSAPTTTEQSEKASAADTNIQPEVGAAQAAPSDTRQRNPTSSQQATAQTEDQTTTAQLHEHQLRRAGILDKCLHLMTMILIALLGILIAKKVFGVSIVSLLY